MSCDHRLLTQHLCDFIEGTLPRSLHGACENALAHCAECRRVYEQALEFQRLGALWEDAEVPPWNRARQAARPPVRATPWLSWGAMAASCLALLLVVLRVEVSFDDGLLISMGGRQAEARVMERLTAELEAWRADSALDLDNRLSEFAAAQSAANELVLSRWLDRGRTERREDLSFLMAAWQTQRQQDRLRFDERLDYLTDSQIESNAYLNDLLRTVELSPRNNPRGDL